MVQFRPKTIQIERGPRGFGLSLIYRGLDKFDERDTGIFVARVVNGGQAERSGIHENDKILTINDKTPRNVDDAVAVIKDSNGFIDVVILRSSDDGDLHNSDFERCKSPTSGVQNFVPSDVYNGNIPISRSGSLRSFNTNFARSGATSPQPQQMPLQPREPTSLLSNSFNAHSIFNESLNSDLTPTSSAQHNLKPGFGGARSMTPQPASADTSFESAYPRSNQHIRGISMDLKKSIHDSESSARSNFNHIQYQADRVSARDEDVNRYKSSHSLHDLGLDNYPNPEMPTTDASRLSRTEEKLSLQNLNNRLAGYIDRVRQLQSENAKLTRQMDTVEHFQSREIVGIKDLYDKQIEELKDALTALNRQYNQLKIGAEGLLRENEDLKDTLRKKEKDLINSNNGTSALEDQIRTLSIKVNRLETEKQKATDELKDAIPELELLREKISNLKRLLDEEQLRRADVENRCKRLEEDLKFKMNVLEEELSEVKQRKEVEITEIDDKLHEEYEDRLQKALEELRGVYDKQLKQSRHDVCEIYDEKLRDLQEKLATERGVSATNNQSFKESRNKIETLGKKIAELETFNLTLKQRTMELTQSLDDVNCNHRVQVASKDEEIRRLMDELSNQLQEYQNLRDVKVALDMEIAVFRKLIESEEDRLGLKGTDRLLTNPTLEKDMKRYQETTTHSSLQKKVTVSQTQL